MKTAAKAFIILNKILLFIFAILIPAFAILRAIINPAAIGLGPSLTIDSFCTIIFGLVVWEALVILVFGFIAIIIENHNNLKKIAENTSRALCHPNSWWERNRIRPRNKH